MSIPNVIEDYMVGNDAKLVVGMYSPGEWYATLYEYEDNVEVFEGEGESPSEALESLALALRNG